MKRLFVFLVTGWGGVTALLMPLLANGQPISEPDPHEPPALLIPRYVLWNFSDAGISIQPTFAARTGYAPPGATPMYGKMEFVDDNGSAGCEVVPHEGNKALLLNGDKLRFRADSPFVGSISCRFKESSVTGGPTWFLLVGGVRLRAIDNTYRLRAGLIGEWDTQVTRTTNWHTVKWQVRWNNDPFTYTGQHRYLEVYLDGALVLRHGLPSRLHTLEVWSPTGVSLELDDVRLEDDPNGTAGVTSVLRPGQPPGEQTPGGTSTHDFDVIAPYHGDLAGYGCINLSLDIPSSLMTAINSDIQNGESVHYYLALWATSLMQSSTQPTPPIFLQKVVGGSGVAPITQVPNQPGWWRVPFLIDRPVVEQWLSVRDGYWFTCAIVWTSNPNEVTRSFVRRMGLPKHNSHPVAFDERLVLLQGPDVRPFYVLHPDFILYDPSNEPTDLDSFASNRRGILNTFTRLNRLAANESLTYVGLNEGGPYLEAPAQSGKGASTLKNFGWEIPVDQGDWYKLHKVVIEYPVDKPRDFILSVTDSWEGKNSTREPISANVFLPGNRIFDPEELGQGKMVVPTSAGHTARRTFYIYPGGNIMVVAMNRTSGMPAAVSSVRVYRESGVVPPPGTPPPPGPTYMQPMQCGIYVEAPGNLRNLFGVFKEAGPSTRGDLQVLQEWDDVPTPWSLPTMHYALRNFMRYQRWVNENYFGEDFLNTIAMDVVYYHRSYFPSRAHERWNWQIAPAQEVGGTNGGHHGVGIPGNVWPRGGEPVTYRYSTDRTAIADFDYAGWVAAVCQGEGVRFLPVLDFRGTAELDYLNYPNFYLHGEDRPEWLNGWAPGDVNDNPNLDVTRFQVARDGHLACGDGSTGDYPAPGHMNAGYNPLHPDVRSRILEIVEDLGHSLRPFMSGSSYLPTASVQNIGLTMSERTRTCLLMHPSMGNIWDETYPITSAKWWRQSDWSYDDKTWGLFRAAYPDVPDDPAPPVNRFAWRHNYLETAQRVEAYRSLRYHELGKLYDDMLCTLGGGTVTAGLALLYLAPSFPGLSVTPWVQGPGNPSFIHDYLRDGIALPERLDPALGITGSRTTYVPAIYAMQNTRYQSPIDGGTLGPQDPTYDQLPTGLSSDTRWTRNRWFDYSTPYRDVVLDHYFPTWPPSGPPHFKVGGWVYHDFIEPWHQAPQRYGWGKAESGQGPHIATVSEPADVEVCWDQEEKSPVFTQWPARGYTPAWSVPYGSFFDYFKRRLSVASGPVEVDILLLGGWDTTSFYGYEHILYDALRGRT